MIPTRHAEVEGNALDSCLVLALSPVSASREACCSIIGPMLKLRNDFSVGDDLSLKQVAGAV